MNAPRIVVVGSLNIDIVATMNRMPRVGETLRGEAVHYIPGGKGANQAVGCARLSAKTAMIGCVGHDVFGDMIKRQLSENGVDVSAVEILEGTSTGTAIISHTAEDNCIIIVGGANEKCTEEMIEKYKHIILDADVLLMQLEIPITTVQKALEIAKQAGVKTILNPAPAQILPEDVKREVDYITPNETEWEIISGEECQTDEALLRTMFDWEKKYGNKVVVTRGEKGCSYLEKDRLLTVSAPKVKVVDTTGAGDVFNAALAFGITMENPLCKTLEFAVKCASLSVQKFGAQDGIPRLMEVI